MKTVNKRKRNRKFIPLIIILTTILLISAIFLIYIYTQNYITVEYMASSNRKASSDSVTSASPIIINNVVVGGVSDKGKWLSKDNMERRTISKGTEIDMYNVKGKMGTFEVYTVSSDNKNGLTYAVPLKDIMNEEYIGVIKSDNNIMDRVLTKITPTDIDEKYVKKALGKYRLLNGSVKVNEVYEAYLDTEQKTRIISATSTGNNKLGVYSVVVFVRNNKAQIIKYSYVKNTESSVNWPVYSIKFACDLNKDNVYEIIVQEARETTMKYSILEYNKNKYYEVIGFKFNIK